MSICRKTWSEVSLAALKSHSSTNNSYNNVILLCDPCEAETRSSAETYCIQCAMSFCDQHESVGHISIKTCSFQQLSLVSNSIAVKCKT